MKQLFIWALFLSAIGFNLPAEDTKKTTRVDVDSSEKEYKAVKEAKYSEKYKLSWMDASWDGIRLTRGKTKRPTEIRLFVCDPQGSYLQHGYVGTSKECDTTKLSKGIPEKEAPEAIIIFPPKEKNGKSIIKKFELPKRC